MALLLAKVNFPGPQNIRIIGRPKFRVPRLSKHFVFTTYFYQVTSNLRVSTGFMLFVSHEAETYVYLWKIETSAPLF